MGRADEGAGEEYYFAFPPGGHYYEPGTTEVNKSGFVAVMVYSGSGDDMDHDSQSVSEGDCNDHDDTIYTGAPEVCGDGIDQDCDGVDESCPVPTVTSAGQVWMDRNLGASRVATSSDDAEAFGDLYQWGRGADGHEKRDSATTATLSSSDDPGHGDFITVSGSPYDWRTPQNDNLWQGESGINNPCPSGFRLPTWTELETERTSWSVPGAAGAFASPTKLVEAGSRSQTDGTVNVSPYVGGKYWLSTVESNGTRSEGLYFHGESSGKTTSGRAAGYSVRCIQD